MVTGFTAEILCMMYTSGDVEEPEILTAELIETLAKEEVRKLCFSLDMSNVTLHDILFAIRHQRRLLIRLVRYLEMLDHKDRSKVGERMTQSGLYNS